MIRAGSGGDKGAPLRTGQWTQAEIAFANQVIQYFHKGNLPGCESGSTLRALLAELLHCSPMRISKKYAGDGAIGKRTFSKSDVLDAKSREALEARAPRLFRAAAAPGRRRRRRGRGRDAAAGCHVDTPMGVPRGYSEGPGRPSGRRRRVAQSSTRRRDAVATPRARGTAAAAARIGRGAGRGAGRGDAADRPRGKSRLGPRTR